MLFPAPFTPAITVSVGRGRPVTGQVRAPSRFSTPRLAKRGHRRHVELQDDRLQGASSADPANVLAHQAYPLQPGDTALVDAAAGGVGALLVQMATQRGAVVIGTTSSIHKAALVRRAGAQYVIVHTQEDVEEATLRLTDQRGVCVMYDGVGGALFVPSLNVLRVRGTLVAFGQAGGPPPPLEVARLSGLTGTPNWGSLSVRWVSNADYLTTVAQHRACAASVFDAILDGGLRLHIADAFPLEQAAHVHRLLESGATSGKLLLQVT